MYCLHLQGDNVFHVWNVRCTAGIGVVVNLSAVHITIDLKRDVHTVITHVSPLAHSYLLTLKMPFTSSLLTSVLLPLPTVQFQLAVHGLSTHICPPPHSMLLALKRVLLEMLSIGSILTLYFSPSQNCVWSDFLQLSHITKTEAAHSFQMSTSTTKLITYSKISVST